MPLPVFVSAPSSLSPQQNEVRDGIVALLAEQDFEARALGRSDYPADLPLREVYALARHCAGGVILGFAQFEAAGGTWKQGTPGERREAGTVRFPSPWNHLESGILYGLSLPLLAFREPGISGGIFDPGTADIFVHDMPVPPLAPATTTALRQVFLKWGGRVREQYYRQVAP
ncbi:hypothetical protein EV699_12118 [Plasticicumulans lactativorans]|uniref:Uncharacterized protein n=1 Tax=Plasticicumulans lactativorans TaxID=1133106 RepID=A0A4R2LHW7_9GAMM|nr:hypothetical protein [Plasticicumulans lactativorans]TCO78905.1 hypothetical protein EV699_12118 [Plasticicumulans lactativorans]